MAVIFRCRVNWSNGFARCLGRHRFVRVDAQRRVRFFEDQQHRVLRFPESEKKHTIQWETSRSRGVKKVCFL